MESPLRYRTGNSGDGEDDDLVAGEAALLRGQNLAFTSALSLGSFSPS
jgi:hypothetical protein